MTAMQFYVYLHRKADTDEVFYVGKGKGQRSHTSFNRTKYWQHVVKKHGLIVEIISRWDLEADALDHEIRLIAEYRSRGVKLVNLTDGGEGASGQIFSEERKKKISVALTGKKHSDETRAKISALLKGKTRPPRSESHKQHLSEAFKGRIITEEHRLKISDARQLHGPYICSKETKEKLSKAGLGRKLSDATKVKISEANSGRKFALGIKRSEETKRRMSESQKGKFVSEETRDKHRLAAANRAPTSAETRRKMSDSHKRAWVSRKEIAAKI